MNRKPRALFVVNGQCTNGRWTGVTYHVEIRRGIEQYAWHVAYSDSQGRRRRRTFFIGTENTWTRARERAAHQAAVRFRRAYEQWAMRGGRHPMDLQEFRWSARAA